MQFVAPLPALVATREDAVSASRQGLSPLDPRWSTIALLVERIPPPSSGESLAALDQLSHLLETTPPTTRDFLAALEHVSPVLRAVASRMEDAGALRLALSVLHSWGHQDVLSAIEQGRTLAQQARVLRQLGAMEQAAEIYDRVEQLADHARAPELRARACIGRGALAHLRGNYPALREWFRKAVDVAEQAGDADLASQAFQGLTIGAATAGDFDRALTFAWEAFARVQSLPVRGAECLVNLAQLVADLGYHRAALSGFAAALQHRPPARVALPALGGAARSAAALRESALLQRIANHAEAWISAGASPYVMAAVLTEVATAFDALADVERGRVFGRRARALAERHDYHELTLRLDTLSVSRPDVQQPRTLDRRGTAVVERVEGLARPMETLVALVAP